MKQKTLSILEFDKITKRLSGFAVSEAAGKRALELMPETDLQTIAALQRETTDAVGRCLKCTNPAFDKLTDVSGALHRAEIGSVLRIPDLLSIGRILQSARTVSSTQGEQSDSLNGYFMGLTADKQFEDRIFGSFLGEDEVADSASSALQGIRRQMKLASERVKGMLNDMIRSSKYQKMLQDPIVTMRAGRHVIPVRAEYRGDVPGMIHDTSASGATLFIEPMAVVNENNRIREFELKEKDEIERILAEFTAEVALRTETIKQNYALLTNLDFLFAKARMSLAMDGVSPELSLSGETELKKARHPLLDQTSVVPVDISLGEGVLIITGPNTGGKTVVLKTIGLLTLMAQAGLHIPTAEQSRVRICKKIFADIGDEQSIEQSLSTFSAHMKNIVAITNEADGDSLVLFDELGAGTDPTEGAALAISIIETVRAFGARVAATTHYSELKVYAMTEKGVQNASCEFDVETLQPTYRLIMGVAGKSNAFAISEKLGLSKKIVEAAKLRLSEETVKFEDVLTQVEESRKLAEKEAAEAAKLRHEISLIRNTVSKEKETAAEKADKVLEKARQQAREIVLEAKRESDALLEEVKELHSQAGKAGMQKKMVEVKTKLNESVKKIQKVSTPVKAKGVKASDLKIGTSVEVAELGQTGTVLSLPTADGRVQVQVGLMKMHVELSGLSLKEGQTTVTRDGVKSHATSGVKRSNVSAATEVDVRGMLLDDALLEVERFLDQAVLASLTQVTIIHGKGTGALRAGIAQHLKTDKRVASFRLGRYGEGESGVTICELR
ncbi:MAG: endonuclease MutS2 [Ruminococcaceae bacterium]|nr:endonuclease MutS2 [Oscillospiraceae bacterium]